MKIKKSKSNLITDIHVVFSFVRFNWVGFLVICLFAFPVGAQTESEKQLSAVSSDETNEKANVTTPISSTAEEANKSLRQKLQRERISINQGKEDNESKNELKKMIEQVRSIVLLPHKKPVKSASGTEEIPMIEPNKVSLEIKTHEESGQKVIQPEPEKSMEAEFQDKPASDYIQKMLESLEQNPERLINPFELAEVLYLGGYENKATIFYREALNSRELNALGSNQEKAWILLQIGNCLRNDDFQSAKNAYRQLIAEYPDYLLVDLAKVQDKLIDWYLTDKPHELVKQCKQLAGGE